MTIQEILDGVSELKGSQPDTELLIRHINTLENRIKKNIVDKCTDREDFPFEHYTAADYNTEVIAPEPYSEVYVWYLIYIIDVRAGNENRQESEARYERAYNDLSAYWFRTHTPMTGRNCHSEFYGI